MDFAKKILSKYGWKEGDGLGKNNDGISKPLKATLKFDTTGFGADQAAADFNNHWWERVFNEAASNINIKQNNEQITVHLKDDKNGVEISTKSYSIKKLKAVKKDRKMEKGYGDFILASTLTNQGHEIKNPDKIATDDIEVAKVKVLTDEELFKACGGRTAHKGARHGINQSGKLARIKQQEEELLANMMEKRKRKHLLANSNNFEEVNKEEINKDPAELIERKKRKNEEQLLEECNSPQTECNKSRKKKKKRKHREE